MESCQRDRIKGRILRKDGGGQELFSGFYCTLASLVSGSFFTGGMDDCALATVFVGDVAPVFESGTSLDSGRLRETLRPALGLVAARPMTAEAHAGLSVGDTRSQQRRHKLQTATDRVQEENLAWDCDYTYCPWSCAKRVPTTGTCSSACGVQHCYPRYRVA